MTTQELELGLSERMHLQVWGRFFSIDGRVILSPSSGRHRKVHRETGSSARIQPCGVSKQQ
jgi:hypothetical protein